MVFSMTLHRMHLYIYIYRALIALLQVLSKAALRWVGSSGKGLRMCWGLGFGLGQLCVVAHL